VLAIPVLIIVLGSIIARALNAENSATWYIISTVAHNTFSLAYIADPIFILRNRDMKEVIAKLSWMPTFFCH